MSDVARMLAVTRAELLRLRRWPAFWILYAVWQVLNILFVYVFNYLAYRTGSGFTAEGVPRGVLLAGLLPRGVPAGLVEGAPMFGGAILLTLGALVAGSGYPWGTWKAALTQGPGRLAVAGGALVASAVTTVWFVLSTLAVDLAVSVSLSTVEGQSLTWPAAGAMLRAIGGALLIFGVWVIAGFLVGTLARGPALAVGLGVVWVLAVENLLRAVASLLDWLRPVTDHLPGTAVGSLAAALGATPASRPGGTPGVLTTLDGRTATIVAAVYLVGFAAVAVALIKRRDVT